jgi:hypothetical protein
MRPISSLRMSIQQDLPSFSAVVGATVTQSPLRLASSARPRMVSSSTEMRTAHETGIRGCRRRSGIALMK